MPDLPGHIEVLCGPGALRPQLLCTLPLSPLCLSADGESFQALLGSCPVSHNNACLSFSRASVWHAYRRSCKQTTYDPVCVQTNNSLSCPLRCVAPSKVVANAAVRKLVHRFKVPRNDNLKQAKLAQSLAQSTLMHSPERLPGIDRPDEEDDEAEIQMSQLCPLNDDILPISAAGLKMKQVRPKVKVKVMLMPLQLRLYSRRSTHACMQACTPEH